MDINMIKLKLLALLHDPAEKAAILMQTARSHEEIAREHIQIILGAPQEIPEAVVTADHIASAADRYNFPRDGKYYAQRFLEAPEIKHPLSGHSIQLEPMQATDLDELQQTVTAAMRKIAETYNDPDDSRRLWLRYLSLWRELPELLKMQGYGSEKFGELWDLLPADTRIPDHSIWDHKDLTSALAGAGIHENKASLFLFSIGPVQDFISASRKTSDLWSGSYLLSYLSWQAMKGVCKECGPDAILFPYLYAQPLVDDWLRQEGLRLFQEPSQSARSVASLPNRFFAIVPSDHASELAQRAYDQVLSEFERISEYAYGKIKGSRNQWQNQIKEFLDCYWVIVPIPEIRPRDGQTLNDAFKEMYKDLLEWNDRSAEAVLDAFGNAQFPLNIGALYGRLYNITEQVHGARKALRNFRQLPEPGYRCSLIPSLAAAVPDPTCGPAELRQFWHDIAQKNPGAIRANERLSAVAVSKRFLVDYLREKTKAGFSNFASTSEVAAADFKLAVLEKAGYEEPLKSAVMNFTREVSRLRTQLNDEVIAETLPKMKNFAAYQQFKDFADLDGEWLFIESYSPESLYREYGIKAETSGAVSALQNLFRRTDELLIPRPSKYYALVLLDGDNMGKWLSGYCSPSFGTALHTNVRHELEGTADPGWQKLLADDVRRPHAPSQHMAISKALNGFSLQLVKRIVEDEHLGKLVYAGGDDVLAFVSFDDALPMLRKLRAAFSGYFNESLNVDWSQQSGFVVLSRSGLKIKVPTMGPNATASAGLVVAHHKHPLQQVLGALRRAEAAAKEEFGRDSFVISILKRSGDQLISGSKWFYQNSKVDVIEVMTQFAHIIETGELARSFIIDWQNEIDGLEGVASVEGKLVELRRLFLRHSNSKLPLVQKQQNFQETVEKLMKCSTRMDITYNLLSTAQFFAKGGGR